MGVWEYGSMGVKQQLSTFLALSVPRSAFRVKKPLGVAENPFPELPFFTK